MAVNDYTDKGYISKYGGGVLEVREVDDAGAWTSGNTWIFGYIQETNFKYKKPKEDVPDETGAIIKALSGNAEVGLSGIFMQSNTTLLDFLRDSTENKHYQLFYKMCPTGDLNGLTQELFAGIAVFTPGFELVSGTRRPTFEITFLKNATEITISSPEGIFNCVVSSTVTIAAGKYYEIVEN